MFSWFKYLIVNLVFPHLGFRSGNLFLTEPFPDLCLLVSFHMVIFFLMHFILDSKNTPSSMAILKGNIDIRFPPHMIFMKLQMLQDNCILGKSK